MASTSLLLTEAALHGHEAIVKHLVEQGADIKMRVVGLLSYGLHGMGNQQPQILLPLPGRDAAFAATTLRGLPCNHGSCCYQCGLQIVHDPPENSAAQCPICRAEVTSVERIFLNFS